MTYLAQTRTNEDVKVDFISAMLNPQAKYNGLYTFLDIKPFGDFSWLKDASYLEIANRVFTQLGIDIDSKLLESSIDSYNSFRHSEITPLVNISKNLYALELYHGPTYAFKDMALQPFSRLLNNIAKARNEKYLILSATSGDTGPATLHGFANSSNIKAICIYPKGGTSDVQRLQMTTCTADNLKVFGIRGDFDLAQSTLKKLLQDTSFREAIEQKGYKLSAANSVNIARIAFQILYYFVIAKNLNGDRFDVIVPSGNFGNALAGFFARELGLPINKICIASNPNDILSEFFNTGKYDLRGKILKLSLSPAMDILKSSNIERLLYAYVGSQKTREYMESLESNGYFALDKDSLDRIQKVFCAHSFSDEECLKGIKEAFNNGYLLDPHTSNGYLFARLRGDSDIAQVVLSTAHFSKFAKATLNALSGENIESDKEALEKIAGIANVKLDSNILSLFSAKEIHTRDYEASSLKDEIVGFV